MTATPRSRLAAISILGAFLSLGSLGALGCVASGGSAADDPNAITDEERLAGQSFDGSEETDEPTVDESGGLASDAELDDVGDDGFGGQSACHHAAGYKRGVRSDICVVPVDGHWVEIHTAAAYDRLRKAAAAKGVHLHIVSGFRTMAEQRRLYSLYLAHKGNLAAPPGYSNHQSGHALDLNTSAPGVYSFLANHGAEFGFRRTVPSEKWHWEHW